MKKRLLFLLVIFGVLFLFECNNGSNKKGTRNY